MRPQYPITLHNLRPILFNHQLTSVNRQTIVYIYQELEWVMTDQLLFKTLVQKDPELGELFHHTIDFLEHYCVCLITLLDHNRITREPPREPSTPTGDRTVHGTSRQTYWCGRKHRLLHHLSSRTSGPRRNHLPCTTHCQPSKGPSIGPPGISNTINNQDNEPNRHYKCVNLATLTDDNQDILCRLQTTNTQIAREIEEIRNLHAIVEELTEILREI